MGPVGGSAVRIFRDLPAGWMTGLDVVLKSAKALAAARRWVAGEDTAEKSAWSLAAARWMTGRSVAMQSD